ncbi:MAG: acyl-CoA dehydrogenase family protein [Alphaproteobacteria bacterium]|nr:acyl-CoA dehydrogenase family protein [Alphaproteobacteria bacterium]MBN9566476.1 acyl-CoA dehydrogenase family protein [Alphaproteobacteria bacterium]MBN9569748.1 acyl-CoA dehydrogenase family protein [Alphaproteobacteria bacterium]
MDFEDTKEEAAFRAEVRKWLDANAKNAGGGGDDALAERADKEFLKRAKAWQARKADAGYARITWPKEVGGYGGTPIQQVIFSQEEGRFDAANLGSPFAIGLGMCIPTLMAYGAKDAVARYVKPALHGEEIWCQLFSEPAGGSDVAGLRTRAEKNGDTWTINGQKIWTTGAQISDYGILLTRTDPNAPKHKGLTMFYLSMKAPGVEVRPIKQASGQSGFNEVFFTDVKIPDSQRLGEVGQGWQVALTTLMHERLAVGGGQGGGLDVPQLMGLARTLELEDGPAIKNAAVREKIADWYVRSAGLKYTTYRTMTALSRGQQPGPEASIAKIVVAPKLQDLSAFAMELEGEAGALKGADAPAHGAFQMGWMSSPGLRIAGGTDEILKNIIAERVLGLPQDVRVDKDVPFNKLPSGK